MNWRLEEIRQDRLANKESEDEVLDLSDSDESIAHTASAAVREPKVGQLKTQLTANQWSLSKPEFDMNLPMSSEIVGIILDNM
jgi:hypothetical protein